MDVGLVCDACTALTPIGVPQCKRCGAAVALDPRAPRGPAASRAADDAPAAGRRSGSQAAAASAFAEETQIRKSPSKGGRSTLFFGAVQGARAKLTLIRGDGEDGVSFTLAGEEHLAGRGECAISFPDDPFISPVHANFLYRGRDLVVRDEGSLNGIYIRIAGTVDLPLGATLLIGEQVLTVDVAAQAADLPDAEGTFYSASMPRPATMAVTQALRGGAVGWVLRVDGEVATVGREGNDINFSEDPFISGRHAELRLHAGALSVTDLGSRNGTFVRIRGERQLEHGDYVFLGQQLLRVEIV